MSPTDCLFVCLSPSCLLPLLFLCYDKDAAELTIGWVIIFWSFLFDITAPPPDILTTELKGVGARRRKEREKGEIGKTRKVNQRRDGIYLFFPAFSSLAGGREEKRRHTERSVRSDETSTNAIRTVKSRDPPVQRKGVYRGGFQRKQMKEEEE